MGLRNAQILINALKKVALPYSKTAYLGLCLSKTYILCLKGFDHISGKINIHNRYRWAEVGVNRWPPLPFHVIYSNVLGFAGFYLSHATLPPLDPQDSKD